ncbi:hypothetical protein EDF56_1011024 [Novosphingobium sp. PhB165]|uniref:hypothetical protein n=1 Tax=Novosphingobium sp. PhB165 TaxID=2485105 RepID=UPI0010DA221B|nr:hypothetical protein [Novosphingobium sp. PhB165]TCM22337.1 hypothetical protein EDF56_1011024 [Novosphingobium sp. PhB165]
MAHSRCRAGVGLSGRIETVKAPGEGRCSGGGTSAVRLWLDRAAVLVPAGMLLVLLLRRVWDVDIFWQLKLGEIILAHGGPIAREPFAALHLGEPLPAVGWLAQASMAAVRMAGGWGALRVFDALCWLGGFWAVAAACRHRGAGRQAVALALTLAFFAALPTASIRPQSFAALCFGLLLALLQLRLRPLVTIALGAPLLVLWQNFHPSVSIGALALGIYAAVGLLDWLRDRTGPLPIAAAALTVIAIAAIFATPDGFSILAISATNAEMSLAIGASEWRPLWIPANWSNAVPVLAVVLLTLRIVLRTRRYGAAEVLVALALLAMTALAYRFALFWALSMVPVIARGASSEERDEATIPRWLPVVALALVAVVTPLLAPTRFAATLPLESIARLRQEHLRGTVYADFPYGGPIIDAGWPDWRVAYDGRYYRYGHDEWQYNGGIENGYVPLVDVIAKWHPVAFLIQEDHNAPLAGELARSPHWTRIFRGVDGVVVYVRRKH